MYASHTKTNWIHVKILFITHSLIRESVRYQQNSNEYSEDSWYMSTADMNLLIDAKMINFQRQQNIVFGVIFEGYQLHCHPPEKIYSHHTLPQTLNFYIIQESLCPFINISQDFYQPSWAEGISLTELQVVTKCSNNPLLPLTWFF